MNWQIRQVSEHEWEVLHDGTRVGEVLATYGAALAVIADKIATVLADQQASVTFDEQSFGEGGSPGLLDEQWESPVAWVSRATAGGRDFTNCAWSWRDPATCLVPLMLQTGTEIGHFGAELAGFITEISGAAQGRMVGSFYDNEEGRELRDMLLDGRRFGVSVDPTESVDVVVICDELDDDGWCMSEHAEFTAYEIGGLTATPFPCFEEAFIQLLVDAAAAPVEDAAPEADVPADNAVAAAGTVALLRRPPAGAFAMAEPEIGSDLLVEQPDGGLACPLTITDVQEDGYRRQFGHLARWGQCHTGYPGECVTAPHSETDYAWAHVGDTTTSTGERLATGVMTAGCDHAAMRLRAEAARDHYAANGLAWADYRATDGQLGVWTCGVVRRDVTDEQAAILAASSLSGDWRAYPVHLELVAALAVNVPGFPIARQAMAASGLAGQSDARFARYDSGGRTLAMVASNVVSRCPDCQARARAAALAQASGPDVTAALARIERQLGVIDRRTRHLNTDAAAAFAASARAGR